MKKGINYWCFDPGTPIPEALNLAAEHGFDGVELILEEKDLSGPLHRFDQARSMAQDLELELPSLATDLYWRFPLSSGDLKVRDRARQVLDRQFEVAVRLGCSAILVVPGLVTPEESYDRVYDRALEALTAATAAAKDAGVTLAVEEVWNRFLLSPLEFRTFLDTIKSPFVKAYFDVGNVLLYAYPEQWIRILADRIACVHVKDFRRAIGTMEGFTHLLQGDVDWPQVIQALRDIGYAGYVSAEIPPYPHLPGNYGIGQLSDTLETVLSL
ncbi:MAG: sugar phosphate isomerase/epimerase [Firmicutes bacterium]|nr:sugar phosphate isomerase/epimerase [Bacillota bacterium]